MPFVAFVVSLYLWCLSIVLLGIVFHRVVGFPLLIVQDIVAWVVLVLDGLARCAGTWCGRLLTVPVGLVCAERFCWFAVDLGCVRVVFLLLSPFPCPGIS